MSSPIESPPALPDLPTPLGPLVELAYNLWWSWNCDAAALFERLDPNLWRTTRHNPVRVLFEVTRETAEAAAGNADFMKALNACADRLRAHLREPPGTPEHTRAGNPPAAPFKAAYFCAEFGLAECLDSYAGGLGLLAGDHLKSASGLALPLVAVGLLYKNGYFHQAINAEGMQEEVFPPVDVPHQPVRRVIDASTGQQKRISVELPGRTAYAAIWRADVGRIPLYLLDTDLPENEPRDRDITKNLYLGDQDTRIRQEIVLGIGGVRALAAVGEDPTVCHMNEGHSAFMALERTRIIREKHGGTFDQAREAAAASHVFTTHTPVPAGIDRFSPQMVSKYFEGYHDQLGLDAEGLLALGRENVADKGEPFSMAMLAIRMSRFCNGVSRLHGQVSRGMWRNVWPGTPRDEIPIAHITNGVHTQGWTGPRMSDLFEKTIGPAWRQTPQDAAAWKSIEHAHDAELWSIRNAARADLVEWCRTRIPIANDKPILDPATLTIGFARRFAAYKRGTLLFRDPDRLERLLKADRPIQLIISGKAHPGDPGGKRLIQDIIRYARERNVQDRVVFIEDYDIGVAQRLVQGCDVWLNTPIRGLEASGTSGMKAAVNGVINVSTLDGWWDEGYAPDLGFHIESIGTFDDDLPNAQREDFESDSLCRLIEHELIPEFYEREGEGGVPRKWVARMKRCIAALAPVFSTHRMVAEYAQRYYFPAHRAAAELTGNGLREAKALSDHIDRIRTRWKQVRITDVQCEPVRAGTFADVSAVVELDGLDPGDVSVQLRHGSLDTQGELAGACTLDMEHIKDLRDGAHRFTLRFPQHDSPRAAWQVRVIPADPRLITPFIPGLIVSGPIQQAQTLVRANE